MAGIPQWRRFLGLRVIALILALGLYWLAAQSEIDRQTVNLVPVSVVNTPRHVSLPSKPEPQVLPPFVSFDITGPRSMVRQINKSGLWYLEIDLLSPGIAERIRDGSTVVEIKKEMVRCFQPEALDKITIDPSSFTPNEVAVRTRLVTKIVPVVLRLQGEPAAGLVITATRVDPPRVTLTGDPLILARVNALPTNIADISRLDRNLEDAVIPLERLPEGISLLQGQSDSVRFSVNVGRK